MPPRAKLLVIERLLPEQALDDAGAVMVDLHMMVINGGRVRTREEIEMLLADAGLSISSVRQTHSYISLIESARA